MKIIIRLYLCVLFLSFTSYDVNAQVVFTKLKMKKQWTFNPADDTKGIVLKMKSTSYKPIRKVFVYYHGVNKIGDIIESIDGYENCSFNITGPIKPKKSFSGIVTDTHYYWGDMYAIPYRIYIEYMDETDETIEITKDNFKTYFPKNIWMNVRHRESKTQLADNNLSANTTNYQPQAPIANNVPPMPVYNGDGNSYVRQIQNRTDQQMANLNNSIQQMKQNAIDNAQNANNRGLKATIDLSNWCAQFRQQNGRDPYENEKDTWMQQNYPDVYPFYIQAKYGDNTQGGNSDKRLKESTGGKRKCSYCTNGRILIEKSVPSYSGINTKKGYCSECKKTYSKAYTHTHVDCSHCKGKGYVNN